MTGDEQDAIRQRVEELKHEPPRIELTRREKVLRVIGWVCSVIAVVSLVVAVYATQQAWDTSTCVNGILGERAPTTTQDARAHIAFAKALDEVFKISATEPKAQQSAQVARFKKAVDIYARTLAADQANRDAHPLGQC